MKNKESLQESDFPAVEKSFALQTVFWSLLGSKLGLEITEKTLFTVNKHTQTFIIMISTCFLSGGQFSFPEETTMQLLVYFTLCSVRSALDCEQDLLQKRSKYELNIIRLRIPDGSALGSSFSQTCLEYLYEQVSRRHPDHMSTPLQLDTFDVQGHLYSELLLNIRAPYSVRLNLHLIVVKGFVCLCDESATNGQINLTRNRKPGSWSWWPGQHIQGKFGVSPNSQRGVVAIWADHPQRGG